MQQQPGLAIPKILPALLSGLLLWLSWPVMPFTLLIFVSWVPLLWLMHQPQKGKRFFAQVYLTMLAWNALTTWWIWNATAPGSIGAITVNSLIMCLPWLGARKLAQKRGRLSGYLSLVIFWLCFEYIHLNDWGLSWPWLTLGNVFATRPDWIQWYEYTGVSGGSLWVLVLNILAYEWLRQYMNTRNAFPKKPAIGLLLTLVVPLLISFLIKPSVQPGKTGYNIVVVQPNIDPYEKIATGTFDAQLGKLIRTSESQIDDSTRLLIWPETAMYSPFGFEEDSLHKNYFLAPLWAFLKRHPQLKLFTGIESYRRLNSENKTSDSKRIGNTDEYYESYNGSVLLDSNGTLQTYHKTMLVPGVETLPGFLKFLTPWFEKFGGTGTGYVKQKERTVINTGEWKLAPAICYESIYGRFMSRYVNNGASLVTIITNDGWWKNTPGHKQHMNYARLRAIENRKWVARSANTGISCFIRPDGSVVQAEPWGKEAAIKNAMITGNGDKTFYVRYGDIIFQVAALATVMILAALIFLWIRKKITR